MSKKSLIRTTLLLLALLPIICATGCTQSDSPDSPDSQTEIGQTSPATQTSQTDSSNESADTNIATKFKADGDWPLFRGNTRSQGVATSGLPNQLEVIWKHEIKGGAFEGSAIIVAAPDQLAIIGDADGKLLAFDLETGEIKWEYVAGDIGFVTAPAFRNDKIYIGDMDGKFHCLSIAGEKLWEFATDNSIDSSANFHNDLVLSLIHI